MTATRDFFERPRGRSEIKLRILSKFIVPWSYKLGAKVRARGAHRLWYVDGFAGPGMYDDGAEGSPIVGARQAAMTVSDSRGHVLGCVNVELDRQRHKHLVENT